MTFEGPGSATDSGSSDAGAPGRKPSRWAAWAVVALLVIGMLAAGAVTFGTMRAQAVPPIAHAGEDQSVDTGTLVTLDGSHSSHPDGSGLTYSWEQIAGDDVALSDAADAAPSFTADAFGTVRFRLTVSAAGLTASDDVSVTVGAALLEVEDVGADAVWRANFDASMADAGVVLQRLRMATTMTSEVASSEWVDVAPSQTLDGDGDTEFIDTDPLGVEHAYRVIDAASGTATNEVLHGAARPSPGTGLPTVYIDTNEAAPIDDRETYLEGRFTMTGSTAFPQCTAVSNALMRVRGRGNYTWSLPKKPYNVTLDDKTDLCGMGKDKKWALLANDYDRSLLRTTVAFQVGELLDSMSYSPQAIPVDVYVNGGFQGSYTLVERVNIGKNRVDIDELEDNADGTNDSAPNVTGGYLLEWDYREDGDHNVFVGADSGWVAIKEPEDEEDGSGITPAQIAYVQGYLNQVDAALFAADFADPVNGWRRYIDEASAVDFYLSLELTKNLDANMYTSVFMYKPRDSGDQPSKLHMGPVWDFDTSLGDAEYPGDQGSPVGWYLRDPIDIEAKQTEVTWFNRLNQDPAFVAAVQARWREMYPQLLTLDGFVAEQASLIASSADLNFQIWDATDQYEDVQVVQGSWAGEVASLRQWLTDRIGWMNAQLG